MEKPCLENQIKSKQTKIPQSEILNNSAEGLAQPVEPKMCKTQGSTSDLHSYTKR